MPRELDAAVPTEIAAVRAARGQQGRALARGTCRTELLTSSCHEIQLRHLRVRVASGIAADVQAKLAHAARQNCMEVVSACSAAAVPAIKDLSKRGQRATLTAGLLGTHLCTPGLILSNGKHGPRICNKAAIAIGRFLWISGGFALHHVEVTRIILGAAGCPSSKWRLLHSEGQFIKQTLALTSGPQRKWCRFEAVALVRASEKAEVASHGLHRIRQTPFDRARCWSSCTVARPLVKTTHLVRCAF